MRARQGFARDCRRRNSARPQATTNRLSANSKSDILRRMAREVAIGTIKPLSCAAAHCSIMPPIAAKHAKQRLNAQRQSTDFVRAPYRQW